jgi:hypothetical protein
VRQSAPIESVVNPDGPDKSVIIPYNHHLILRPADRSDDHTPVIAARHPATHISQGLRKVRCPYVWDTTTLIMWDTRKAHPLHV